MKALQKKELIAYRTQFENDVRLNREPVKRLSEVGQNGKTEETVWQPYN